MRCLCDSPARRSQKKWLPPAHPPPWKRKDACALTLSPELQAICHWHLARRRTATRGAAAVAPAAWASGGGRRGAEMERDGQLGAEATPARGRTVVGGSEDGARRRRSQRRHRTGAEAGGRAEPAARTELEGHPRGGVGRGQSRASARRPWPWRGPPRRSSRSERVELDDGEKFFFFGGSTTGSWRRG
ncbi:unnamed protein product [Urochloa humidicola]